MRSWWVFVEHVSHVCAQSNESFVSLKAASVKPSMSDVADLLDGRPEERAVMCSKITVWRKGNVIG